MISSLLYSLDNERQKALDEVLADIERTRAEQLNSKFAKADVELQKKINELHDKIANELKTDVNNGSITPGNSVDKRLKGYEESLQKMKEKKKEKNIRDLEMKIAYLKWLVGDKDITIKPEKAVIY